MRLSDVTAKIFNNQIELERPMLAAVNLSACLMPIGAVPPFDGSGNNRELHPVDAGHCPGGRSVPARF